MSTVLRGYEHSQGQFTDKKTGELVDYENFKIHYTTDERKEVAGLYCDHIKCKGDSFKLVGVDTLDEALNREVLLMWDPTSDPEKPVCAGVYVIPVASKS